MEFKYNRPGLETTLFDNKNLPIYETSTPKHGKTVMPDSTNEVDAYIAKFPAEVQAILQKVRETIRTAAPDTKEIISYKMPAYRRHGILVYFAAWKNHIGLYPPISGNATIEKAVAKYAGPKGNLQFPLAEPIPYNLIARIVKLRVEQDNNKATAKPAKRKKASDN